MPQIGPGESSCSWRDAPADEGSASPYQRGIHTWVASPIAWDGRLAISRIALLLSQLRNKSSTSYCGKRSSILTNVRFSARAWAIIIRSKGSEW